MCWFGDLLSKYTFLDISVQPRNLRVLMRKIPQWFLKSEYKNDWHRTIGDTTSESQYQTKEKYLSIFHS